MILLNESNLQSTMEGKFLLVQFGSEWCSPCNIMKRNLGGLERQIKTENLKFGYIDTEKYPVLEERYEVEYIPTVILFKDGQELGRFDGCRKGADVRKFIGECLNS
jgi:thioredoxin-like negative regulator of GroEL